MTLLECSAIGFAISPFVWGILFVVYPICAVVGFIIGDRLGRRVVRRDAERRRRQ